MNRPSTRTAGGAVGALEAEIALLPRPLLILSTAVGRGMYSIGEALHERAEGEVEHRAVEDFLPPSAMREDVERYRAISSRFPLLLHLPYRVPLIYQRKLLRERHLRTTDLTALSAHLETGGFGSVLAVSHRPTFWAALAKERAGLDVSIVGLSGEYGSSLGWRYVPWSSIQRFLTPVPASELRFAVPAPTTVQLVPLPARAEYEALASEPGDPNAALVVCGLWGQGRIDRILKELRGISPELTFHAVCGENDALRRTIESACDPRVRAYGVVPSLAPILRECASVITKPGIATVLETHAARRAMFLIPGMPVAEDNNLRFALHHMGALRYSRDAFRGWLEAAEFPPEDTACRASVR
ncbi:Processive diacylglycerol beta-glucosyltransferase [Planctomycetes bacterium Poly30]|uniref:Processive diacylglycerol beta-glucosyltransferase n=1 Tax=Saltatorellus ferox TaxID=2528018 RepID=A0A518EYL2_9BACT|nr:Processive diacylglycerol beta-glucosyltransferase [Planctomycetes bacterium Poly30]